MAKPRKEESQTNGAGKGEIKFRYTDEERTVQFSMKNITSESVTEGLRSLANALAGTPIAVPSRRLTKGTGAVSTDLIDHENEQETPELDSAEEEVETSTDENSTDEGEERPRRRPAARAPKFLSELNLTTASVSLEDFIAQKNPQSDIDKYAVIAQWFKEHFTTEEISIDHIFTAYRKLGWQSRLPGPDPSQTLRNLKNYKNWFDNGTKRGFFKINWNGTDAVNKMGAVSA